MKPRITRMNTDPSEAFTFSSVHIRVIRGQPSVRSRWRCSRSLLQTASPPLMGAGSLGSVMSHPFHPASKPTMYFIGVTTRQSSINAVFPRWAQRLDLGDCELRGIDFALHAQPQRYRAAVQFIKRDPLSLGALVTTHKIDLYTACADQFDVM